MFTVEKEENMSDSASFGNYFYLMILYMKRKTKFIPARLEKYFMQQICLLQPNIGTVLEMCYENLERIQNICNINVTDVNIIVIAIEADEKIVVNNSEGLNNGEMSKRSTKRKLKWNFWNV